MSGGRGHFSIINNPKRTLGAVMGAQKAQFSIHGRRGRKPSPRKLEPHEVIAKLKARSSENGKPA